MVAPTSALCPGFESDLIPLPDVSQGEELNDKHCAVAVQVPSLSSVTHTKREVVYVVILDRVLCIPLFVPWLNARGGQPVV